MTWPVFLIGRYRKECREKGGGVEMSEWKGDERRKVVG
jgi:hypothetical protein